MKKYLLFVLLTGSSGVFAQGWTLNQLAQQFAGIPESRAAFVERKTSALLDQPLITRGMLYYAAPDKLTKDIKEPEKATWFIYGDEVILERPGQPQQRFPLDAHPALRPLTTSIRSLLAGRIDELKKYYATRLEGDQAGWQLLLTPIDASLKNIVRTIAISGQGHDIKRIMTQEANGDRTEMLVGQK